LERSDYPGGVSHKKSWKMFAYRLEAAYQQAITRLGESSAIVGSEQTSCACGTPVAAPRQPVPPSRSGLVDVPANRQSQAVPLQINNTAHKKNSGFPENPGSRSVLNTKN